MTDLPHCPVSRLCPIPRQPECRTSHDHLCPQPQTPHLEEDLKEVLRSEAGIELIIEDDTRPEKQKRKPGVSGGEPAGGLEPWGGAWARGHLVKWGALLISRQAGLVFCLDPPLSLQVVGLFTQCCDRALRRWALGWLWWLLSGADPVTPS